MPALEAVQPTFIGHLCHTPCEYHPSSQHCTDICSSCSCELHAVNRPFMPRLTHLIPPFKQICQVFCFLLSCEANAGHGSQTQDWQGEEEDGYNETLCPCDFKQASTSLACMPAYSGDPRAESVGSWQ